MTSEFIYERLTPIFRNVFQEPTLEVVPEMNANDVARWNSLTHTELISAVETAFNVKFGFREVTKWKKVGDMVETLLKKQA